MKNKIVTGNSKAIFITSVIVILLFTSNYICAQDPITQTRYDFSYQSKLVSSELEKPEVDNTGTITIQIPLYTLTVGNLSIPFSLSYNTGGIKVAERPSIVGLGWNISCGGVVTRIPKGTVDEYVHLIEDHNYAMLALLSYGASYDVSYIGNYGKLDRSDWNTDAYKSEILNNGDYAFYDNVWGTGLKTVNIDLAPDEFQFSVNGLSGSFFMDHKGKWVAKCDKPVTIDVGYQNSFSVPSPSTGHGNDYLIPRIISTITITDGEGNKYIFGKTTDDNAIELSRNMTQNRAAIDLADLRFYTNEVVAVAWYLSKIITADGEEATYQYDGVYQLNTRLESNLWYVQPTQYGSMKYLSKSLVRSPLLKKITTSNGISVDFSKSGSIQLDNEIFLREVENTGEYGFSEETIYKSTAMIYYHDIYPGAKATLQQLNEINVKYLNEPREKITFTYNSVANARLKLSAVNFFGSSLSQPVSYSFNYNTTPLPGYNSGMEDLLGYYNGVNYFSQFSTGTNFTLSQLTNNYLPSRSTNASYISAESLNKITTPEGGTIEYEFEPNYYRSYVDFASYNLVDLPAAKSIGGQRVKKITINQNSGSPAKITNFYYVKDYQLNPSSGISSGVLYDDLASQLITNYTQGGPGNDLSWKCVHKVASNRKNNESPLTYSEITIAEPGNGYKIRKFSSYTTGQLDAAPFNATISASYPYTNPALHCYNKKNIDRGKLLSEEVFNNAEQLVMKTSNTYYFQDYTARPHLRTVQYLKREINLTLTAYSFVAYPQYNYNNFLSTRETINYEYSGGITKSISQFEKYYYNNAEYPQLLTRIEKTDSKGNISIVENKYGADFFNTAAIFDEMKSRGMIAMPVDKTNSISKNSQTTELGHTHFNYALYNSNTLLKVASIQSSLNGASITPGSMDQTDITYGSYNSRGRVLQATSKGYFMQSNLWDSKSINIIAKCSNAQVQDIAYTSFEDDEKGNWSYSGTPQFNPTITGRKNYSLTPTAVLAKSGLNSSLTYILSYWTQNSVAFTISGTVAGYPVRGRNINGWTYFEHKITGQLSAVITGTGMIDEVKLYPADAQMISMTYDPLIGATTQNDFGDHIMYYEYDEFKRLLLIRNQDKNILKKYCYNYTGQTENCSIFYNELKTGNFSKSNCPSCTIPATVMYVVPANKYISTHNQEEANTMAQNEIDANGQAWTDQNAACTPVPLAGINSYSGITSTVAISFYNIGTATTYNYTIPTGTNGYPPGLPCGNYNVVMNPATSGTYIFHLNSYTQQTSGTASFYNVSVAGNVSINITN